jgi:hypothetical protein
LNHGIDGLADVLSLNGIGVLVGRIYFFVGKYSKGIYDENASDNGKMPAE